MADPLQHTLDLHPHTTTMAAGARLAKYAQSIITRDQLDYNVTHTIHCPVGEGIGKYMIDIHWCEDDDPHGDYERVSEHTFDIELLLAFRDGWKAHVEKHVLRMMREVRPT